MSWSLGWPSLEHGLYPTVVRKTDKSREGAPTGIQITARLPVPQKMGDSPMLALPKNLPDLVDEEGGGGFWIWEAVGARDWRMEYVRCMMGGVVVGSWSVCHC